MSPSIKIVRALLLLSVVVSWIIPATAFAHGKRENYVWLNVEKDHINGRFEINIKHLRDHLNIEIGDPGAERVQDILDAQTQVQNYLLENFSLKYNGEAKTIQFLETTPPEDENKYVKYHFRTEGVPENDLVQVENTIFLTEEYLRTDPLHKSLVLVDYNRYRELDFGEESTAKIFGPHLTEAEINVAIKHEILVADDFLVQGMLHIWAGFDHMLFLITLLLTTVLIRENRRWEPVPKVSSAFINTLKIVTIFTISHSVTLVLAVKGLVGVPTVLVEAIIAFSVIVVALNNIFPLFSAHTWVLIFAFGLIHGMGFASAMGDLQFRNVKIEKVLILFSLGIEIGQVVVVCIVLPLLYLIRKTEIYRKVLMPGLSLLCVIIATHWLGVRVGWW